MTFSLRRLREYLFEQTTLRKRILLIFGAATLIPFLCAVLLSHQAITAILNKNLNSGVQSNLHQVKLSLESTISNLNHVSQQLAYPGSVGQRLEQLLMEVQPYERASLVESIKSELNLITFTNPSTGLVLYYFTNQDRHMFESTALRSDFSLQNLPRLAEYHRITYFGPHVSNTLYNDQYVLSAMRQIDLPDQNGVFVYIESDFKLTQNILESDRIAKHSYHLILDNDQRIAYSEVADVFPRDTYFEGLSTGGGGGYGDIAASGQLDGYYWFKSVSNQGWSIVSLIPSAEYNEERNTWLLQMGGLLLLFTIVALLISWLLWKMVYKPLNQFSLEMKNVIGTRTNLPPPQTTIPEFVYLIHQFRNMKDQISTLFQEVEQKEKRRADLEVEKLRHQINPHFLMNTLDTAHWLAVMNGQKEIDRLVLSLNKLLHYNLGKLGEGSTIREEIDSLRQYLILQQIRYDFEFDVRIDVDDAVLDIEVPRFILQPLVENALYHGLDDGGQIFVGVALHEEVEITIEDNGTGITDEKIAELLEEKQDAKEKVGMGIGMSYVKRIIHSHYEGQARLTIDSELGKGTAIRLFLPYRKEDKG
ncbi:sensor histidine kinase [Paenibacillus sp. 1P07SE]|uniref:sensor histidine kinase n=1 Tax=Paenibacillus sp. 1P07SE TaxID=3132209 RepID=UPI0039A591A6